jgi:phosphatidylinositol alpha-1,6-mannosyltransferase
MLRLANEIHAAGRRVVVVAPSARGTREYDSALPYRVIRYRRFTRFPFGKVLDFATICTSLTKAFIESGEATSIASAWWPAGLSLAIVAPRFHGRYITIAHGMEIKPNSSGLRRFLMRYVFKRSHGVVANSSFTRHLLESAGILHRVNTVACGVDDHYTMPKRSKEPTVLSVGRLIERKGFDRTLEAIALLLPEFPTIRYEIVGNGPQRAELQQLCAKLQISDRVAFLGALSDEDIGAAYARAWCFALPARRIDDDVEGFGIVYLEAAMCELATVGGIDSGAIDAIESGRTGLLVDGDNALAISQALETLLKDRHLADMMGKRGRERALRDFRWSDITTNILKILQ